MMTAPKTLEDLLAVEAIKQLKARYFLFMDTKRWDEWRDLFTDDVRVEGGPPHEGRDAFVDFVRTGLQDVQSAHQGHMPIIEVISETSARGIWAMSDDLLFPAGHPWAGKEPRRCGYGHYDEEYRREGGRWRISRMRLTYARLWTVPEDGSGTTG